MDSPHLWKAELNVAFNYVSNKMYEKKLRSPDRHGMIELAEINRRHDILRDAAKRDTLLSPEDATRNKQLRPVIQDHL